MTPISNQPCRKTEPIRWCRTRLQLALFVTCILLMGNGARAECAAHDVLQRHLPRAGNVATAPVLRVPQLQQQKDSTNSGSLEIESWVCDSDLTVLLVHSWYSEVVTTGAVTRFRVLKSVAIRTETSSGNRRRGFAGPSEQRLPTEVFFPKKRLKVSQDEACHVCISPNTTPAGICIYLPYKA